MQLLSHVRLKIGTLLRRRPPGRSSEHHQMLAGEEEGFVICGEVDALPLVQTLARAFLGGGHLMIEGHLPDVETEELAISSEVPSSLRRHTTWSFPKEQVLVVPLELETIEKVCSILVPSAFGGAAAGGISNHVTHVQIERDGRLEFGAYDWFEFAWVSRRVDEEVLMKLRESRVIGDYAPLGPDESWPC